MSFFRRQKKKVTDVFGVSNTVLEDSYVDRGRLDEEFGRYLARPTHIAVRGESKCGKTWLREKVVPDALVVQCRLGKSCVDIYQDALNKLGIRLEVESQTGGEFRASVEAETQLGHSLLARIGLSSRIEASDTEMTRSIPVTGDLVALVGQALKEGNKRLVIEDFHYLAIKERRRFAFDMKALWDQGVFIVVVGVWTEQNMLLFLNSDLTARVREISVVWSAEDLGRVLDKGGEALNIRFTAEVKNRLIEDCYGNVGILQALTVGLLDELGITEEQDREVEVGDLRALESAALVHADQLSPLYQEFAERVSRGLRKRKDATGIYAHTMAVILERPDDALLRGVPVDDIFALANARQPRIQKANLETILKRFEELQVDDDGRGLVLAYNEALKKVTVVDRQLLLYRRYSTVSWPWEDLIREAEAGSVDDEGSHET